MAMTMKCFTRSTFKQGMATYDCFDLLIDGEVRTSANWLRPGSLGALRRHHGDIPEVTPAEFNCHAKEASDAHHLE